MRRTRLRGLFDVTKRYLIAAAAHNLGLILFKLFGIGKPRSLQRGYGDAALALLTQLLALLVTAFARLRRSLRIFPDFPNRFAEFVVAKCSPTRKRVTSTDC